VYGDRRYLIMPGHHLPVPDATTHASRAHAEERLPWATFQAGRRGWQLDDLRRIHDCPQRKEVGIARHKFQLGQLWISLPMGPVCRAKADSRRSSGNTIRDREPSVHCEKTVE